MNKFAIATPKDYAEATGLLTDGRFKLPILKAGGMDVVDHLKEGLIEPDLVINIKRLQNGGEPIASASGSLTIQAATTLAQIAGSLAIIKQAPVLAQACDSAATPQVRNVATAGGNLLQRPRCWYYRNDQFDCLKKGGPTCYAAAAGGENRYHAIFGDGPCHIVHPSNLAPALMVCDGIVHLTGAKRESIRLADLYHMPDKGIRSEHNLEPTEIITHITLSPAPVSGFYAVKEKQSFDWPVVLACVALTLDGDTIKSSKVCAGAVAPIPWALPNVEAALKGVSLADDAALRKACEHASDGAKPMSQNAYKTKLLPVAVRRAILRAAGKLQEAHA